MEGEATFKSALRPLSADDLPLIGEGIALGGVEGGRGLWKSIQIKGGCVDFI